MARQQKRFAEARPMILAAHDKRPERRLVFDLYT